jgi:predicted nucleic acid-binding protein
MKNEQYQRDRKRAFAIQVACVRRAIEEIAIDEYREFYADADLIEQIAENGSDATVLQHRARTRQQTLLKRADKTRFPIDEKVLHAVSLALGMAANAKAFVTFDNILLADAVDDVCGNPPEATELMAQRRLAEQIRAGA